MNPRALAGSTVVHAVVLFALFVFVPPGRAKVPLPAIQVALVNLPTGAIRPSEGEAVETPEKAAAPEKASRVESAPEKNAIRPPDEKKPLPQRPRAGVPGGVKTPKASLGVSGLSGEVSVDAADFAFTYYLILVRNRIGENWGAPAGLVTNGNRVRATVFFRIDRIGRVTDVKLEEPSGVPFFDQSAVRAVSVSSPLPPLPAEYSGSSLGVHFGFEYVDR